MYEKLKRQASLREVKSVCYSGSSLTATGASQSGAGIGAELGSAEQSDKTLFICKPVKASL